MVEMQAIRTLTMLRWLAGPIVWAAHFTVAYASESLLCTRGGGASAHLALIAAATALAIAVLLAATVQSWRRASSSQPGAVFMDQAAIALGLLGMLAVLWSALPAMIVSSCVLPA